MITLGGVHYDDTAFHQRLIDAALAIAEEPLAGLSIKDTRKLKNRVMRMDECTIRTLSKEPSSNHQTHAEKVVLATYAFIENLVTQEYITMPEDSALAKLMDFLLSLVDTESAVFDARYAGGMKIAKKWLKRLQEDGYFAGVTFQ